MEQRHCCCDLTKARQLIADEVVVERMAQLYTALSQPIRVKLLLAMLNGEICVQGFVELLGVSQPSISNQLAKLKSNGLVKSRRQKNNIYYSLDDEHIHDLVEIALQHIEHI